MNGPIHPAYQIPFSPPDISETEIEEVVNILRSGWITTGPKVNEFERMLAEYIGCGISDTGTPRCVCLNSQTAAGELSLRLLGIGPQEGGSAEDEVITCAYTYTATASVVAHIGAKLVLVDCQKDSYSIDYDALEKAITPHTKAVIPVELGGVPCDYDRIFEIVERKKSIFRPGNDLQKALGRIAVVSDCAHAIGARALYGGQMRMAGNIADFSNFSFHAVKNLTTSEGGACTWKEIDGYDSDLIHRKLKLYCLHGQSKSALEKSQQGKWEYDVIGTWYKSNMTDISAAIGVAQLRRYPDLLMRREAIVSRYDHSLLPVGIDVFPHKSDWYISSKHLYLTRIPGITEADRNEIIRKLAERGISSNVHYKPLPMHTAYRKMGFCIADYPNAFTRYANEITLPLHTKLTDDEVNYIIENYIGITKDYL